MPVSSIIAALPISKISEICKKHGFKPANIAEYNEETKALHEILTRLKQLEKTNNAILNHYNGDKKFAYVHKRIREENKTRESIHKAPIISKYDEDIVKALTTIKATIDEKVYNRNDILKQDDYFERTVTQQIALGLQQFENLNLETEDYTFIQKRITKQYIDQYNSFYRL